MNDQDSEEDVGPNRRAISAAVVLGREARQLVAPVQEKLGAWQAQTVKLEVMVQRLKASGRNDAGLGEAARTLLGVVAMHSKQLDASIESASGQLKVHSRVLDARRVLDQLIGRLEKVLADIGEPSDEAR